MPINSRWLTCLKSTMVAASMTILLSACSNSVQDTAQYSDSKSANIQLLDKFSKPIASVDADANSDNEEQFQSGYIAPELLVAKLKKPVNDFTGTLSAKDRAILDKKIRAAHKEEILQIGVVIVDTTAQTPLFDYAMKVAQEWALGSTENNNGLLIVVVIKDQKIYILTGLDVEDKLTDERVAKIIDDDITPHFANADYMTGLSVGIDALIRDMRHYKSLESSK